MTGIWYTTMVYYWCHGGRKEETHQIGPAKRNSPSGSQ